MVFSALSQNIQDSPAQARVPNAKCLVDAQSNLAHLLARQETSFQRFSPFRFHEIAFKLATARYE
jgi:hypothetical protein